MAVGAGTALRTDIEENLGGVALDSLQGLVREMKDDLEKTRIEHVG